MVLCAKCHFAGHEKPLWFAEQVKKIKGRETYDWLLKEIQNLKPLGIKDLEKIYKEL